jgi:hypothetical protein
MVSRYSVFLVFIALSACVGTTTIVSNPPGAAVYVRDTLAGITPFVYQDIRVSFTKRNLVVKQDGHAAQTVTLRRNARFEPINLLGAPLVYPLLYLVNYPDTTHIYMAKSTLTTSDRVAEESELERNPDWVQEALEELKSQYKQGVITKKQYKLQRRNLKSKLQKAGKNG